MKEFLKKVNVPVILCSLFILKCIVLPPSIADAICFISICSLYGYFLYLNKNKLTEQNLISQEIADLKNEIQSVKIGKTFKKTFDHGQRLF